MFAHELKNVCGL